MREIRTIPISSIDTPDVIDSLMQTANAAKVASLVKALNNGAELPPISVFEAVGKRYLADAATVYGHIKLSGERKSPQNRSLCAPSKSSESRKSHFT